MKRSWQQSGECAYTVWNEPVDSVWDKALFSCIVFHEQKRYNKRAEPRPKRSEYHAGRHGCSARKEGLWIAHKFFFTSITAGYDRDLPLVKFRCNIIFVAGTEIRWCGVSESKIKAFWRRFISASTWWRRLHCMKPGIRSWWSKSSSVLHDIIKACATLFPVTPCIASVTMGQSRTRFVSIKDVLPWYLLRFSSPLPSFQ